MSFSYGARAAILGFGFFFLFHAAMGLALSRASNLRIFERMNPRASARLLLALRLLPALSALVLTCGIVVPAYFQWEPQKGTESVSILIALGAVFGILIWIQSLIRTARALYSSLRLQGSGPQQVLETRELFLAVSGIVHPRIIVSRGFLESIPAEQRDVAMRHEMAHFRAGDNLHRLLMLLAPPVVPGFDSGYALLEQAWARYAERAADDHAAGGDAARASVLAEVLVRVARNRFPHQTVLASALVGSQNELPARVERLLTPPDSPYSASNPMSALVYASLLLTPLILAICLVGQSAPKPVFQLIEHLLLHA